MVLVLLQETPLIKGTAVWAVAQVVTILFVIVAIFLLGREMIQAASGSTRSNPGSSQGERSSRDFGSFYVVAFGITAVFFGFIVMLLFANTFTDNIAPDSTDIHPTVVSTDPSGQAPFTFTNGGNPGIDTIEATALGGRGTATVEFAKQNNGSS